MDTVINEKVLNKSSSSFIFMQNKVFMDDIINVAELCSKKCIRDYNQSNLNSSEEICLERCYFKSLEMNNYISKELPNIFPNFKLTE